MNINRLKDLREDYDLTQKEVADICILHNNNILNMN